MGIFVPKLWVPDVIGDTVRAIPMKPCAAFPPSPHRLGDGVDDMIHRMAELHACAPRAIIIAGVTYLAFASAHTQHEQVEAAEVYTGAVLFNKENTTDSLASMSRIQERIRLYAHAVYEETKKENEQ